MGSKKTTKTNQTTTNTLPSWLTSPYQQLLANNQERLTAAPTNDNTTAAFNDYTSAAGTTNTQLTDVASQLAAIANGQYGSQALEDTAAGKYLTADSNPYIRGVADQGADAAQARINAQFGAAGRSNGSGLYAQLFGQGIADAANSVYAQNYSNERQLQEAAAGNLLQTRYNALAAQPGVLQTMLGNKAGVLQAANAYDNLPLTNISQQAGILNQISSPYAIQNMVGKTTEKTGGVGTALGTLAQVGGAVAGAAAGNPFAGLSLVGGSGAGSSMLNFSPLAGGY